MLTVGWNHCGSRAPGLDSLKHVKPPVIYNRPFLGGTSVVVPLYYMLLCPYGLHQCCHYAAHYASCFVLFLNLK